MSKKNLVNDLVAFGKFSTSVYSFKRQFRSVFLIQLGKKVFGFASYHVGVIIEDNRATSARNFVAKFKKPKCHCTRFNAFLQSTVHNKTELIDELIVKFILRGC